MSVIDVVIVGAGLGGLGAAIRLRQCGVGSLVILERSTDVGGTWRDNDYPGCACDVPAHLYSFSFAPGVRWSRPFPQQGEIQDYIQRLVDTYVLRPLIRFSAEVRTMQWLAGQECWQVDIAGHPPVLARYVVLAAGPLNKPMIPDLPGVKSFAGVAFHSSQWRQDVELAHKRVAVVGTGASAVQIVPEIAPDAAHVDVFQRTASWVVPRWDHPYGAVRRWMYRYIPGLQRLSRWRVYWFNELVGMAFMGSKRMQTQLINLSRQHLRKQVSDPQLRAVLTPDFSPGCKRLLISNTWFPALQRTNVSLLTQAVIRVEPQGVVGADGVLYPCDVIVWATGFNATEFVAPMKIFGAPVSGDQAAPELGALWRAGSAATHLGITVANFPNLFMLVGPNTGLGHNSIVFMIECQVNYIVQALRSLHQSGLKVLHLRPQVQHASYRFAQQRMATTVWASGCKSWYQHADGHIDTLWPGYTWEYWLKTRRFQISDYL